ncbi:MAG: nicotinate-nicotinamide nucleotide adenylyltransferase [Waltera sp.]
MSRIGIMGGTFNPIHIGHLMLAEQALESAHLDQIWMIPTGCSYLKTKEGITVLPGTERYDMVQLAIADNDRFRCLDIEIKRPGDSYSYETMEQLHERISGPSFLFHMRS